jgi:hypothetical protein
MSLGPSPVIVWPHTWRLSAGPRLASNQSPAKSSKTFGLPQCSQCHSPRTMVMQLKGALLAEWSAVPRCGAQLHPARSTWFCRILLPWPAIQCTSRLPTVPSSIVAQHSRDAHVSLKYFEMHFDMSLRNLVNRLQLQPTEEAAYEITPVQLTGSRNTTSLQPFHPVLAIHSAQALPAIALPDVPPLIAIASPYLNIPGRSGAQQKISHRTLRPECDRRCRCDSRNWPS